MLARLAAIQERLARLARGEVPKAGLARRLRAWLGWPKKAPSLERVRGLDRELEAVGIHSVADVALLRALALANGRVGALATSLAARAEEALAGFELALEGAELRCLAGRGGTTEVEALERLRPALTRIARAAELFARPAGAAAELGLGPLLVPAASAPIPPRSAVLALAELYADTARLEVEDVLRKREDLERAVALLSRVGEDEEAGRVLALRLRVSEARDRALSLPPVSSGAALVAALRRDLSASPERVYAALRGWRVEAVCAWDGALAEELQAAALACAPSREVLEAAVERAEVTRLLEGGPSPWERSPQGEPQDVDDELLEVVLALPPERRAALELAEHARHHLGATSRSEVSEGPKQLPAPVLEEVPFPAGVMTFSHTGSVGALARAELSDPRLLLYELATGRQRVRTFLRPVPVSPPRPARGGGVRVYVCDASGSMFGARARFRDGLLLGELNRLRLAARRGLRVEPLYFCFFRDDATPLVRVEDAAGAKREMLRILSGSPARGRTDVTSALVSAFQSVRGAQGEDPHLARASVVLVTDGEDRLDLRRLQVARAQLGALTISLSFVSLGEENRELQRLAREQREAGGRGFYLHLSDAELSLSPSELDLAPRTLLPPGLPLSEAAREALLPQLDALERLLAGRPVEPDRTAPQFELFFPDRPAGDLMPPSVDQVRLVELVEAVAEAAALVPAPDRAAEAVRLLCHLLETFSVSRARYLERLATPPRALAEAVSKVRLICAR